MAPTTTRSRQTEISVLQLGVKAEGSRMMKTRTKVWVCILGDENEFGAALGKLNEVDG